MRAAVPENTLVPSADIQMVSYAFVAKLFEEKIDF